MFNFLRKKDLEILVKAKFVFVEYPKLIVLIDNKVNNVDTRKNLGTYFIIKTKMGYKHRLVIGNKVFEIVKRTSDYIDTDVFYNINEDKTIAIISIKNKMNFNLIKLL